MKPIDEMASLTRRLKDTMRYSLNAPAASKRIGEAIDLLERQQERIEQLEVIKEELRTLAAERGMEILNLKAALQENE